MTAPLYELRKTPLYGTHYVQHSIVVNGAVIYAQVGPMSEAEIESRLTAHLNPAAPRPYALPELVPGAAARGAKGGAAKKSASMNVRGFLWKETEEE